MNEKRTNKMDLNDQMKPIIDKEEDDIIEISQLNQPEIHMSEKE